MDPPAKKQKLLSKACEACRLRKAKCDGAIPSCQSCLKRGVGCVYREREQPGLRPGFGKNLEERLSRMEGSLDEIRGLLQGRGLVQNTQRLGNIYDASQSASSRELSMPLDTALYTGSAVLEMPPDVGDVYAAGDQPEMPEGLPSRHLLQRLSSLYFELAHPWMNFLSQSKVEAGIASIGRFIQLHCVTLIGFRYWGEFEPGLEVRQEYMENSRQRLLAVAMDEVSIASAQALATLAVDSLGQGPSSRTLNLMSLLNTATTQLDLAKRNGEALGSTQSQMVRNPVQNAKEEQGPEDDSAQASRLFWTVYTLDRIISVSHGLRCTIAPNLFSRGGPAMEAISTPAARIEALVNDVHQRSARAGLTSPWLKLVQVMTLIERVNEFIVDSVDLSDPDQSRRWKSRFRALDAALCAWRDSQLVDCHGSDAIEVTAHAMYHTSVIRMHSVAAFPPRTCSLTAASPLAPGRCHQAVKSICGICETLKPGDLPKMSPLFVFAVWVASRNMVTLWTSGWEEQTAAIPPELTTLRDCLRAMALYWPCAEKFTAMIDFVVDLTGKTNQYSMLEVFNDVSHTAYGLHGVLEPRIKRDRDVEMAQLWNSFSVPGMEDINPFV